MVRFIQQWFGYTLTGDTRSQPGLARTAQVGLSYIKARLHQRRPEKSLEDFLINRFGRQLYLTFFKSYTEKVWGVRCDQISAEWGAQRAGRSDPQLVELGFPAGRLYGNITRRRQHGLRCTGARAHRRAYADARDGERRSADH